jgi:hypothetical protein
LYAKLVAIMLKTEKIINTEVLGKVIGIRML